VDTPADGEVYARRITAVFNQVAPGYDSPALRFFPFTADRLIQRLQPARGEKILDVATGTGAVALAAAQAVGPEGRVTGIDLAESMLARLEEKIRQFGIANLDLHVMNAAALDFRRDYFHHTVCSFGLFFLPDMLAGLKEWVRVTRPGGQVMFTCFGPAAFQPLSNLFIRRVEQYGITLPVQSPRVAAESLKNPDTCLDLLRRAGLMDVAVQSEQKGYHLKDGNEWWEVIWNSGYRGMVEQIPPEQQARFRQEHLAEVGEYATPNGLWMDVEVYFASGTKPVL
jgi:ubiquinone/menaquinone biosynthesis C-methylase UbiE